MVSNKSSKCSLTEASTDKKIKKKKKIFKSNRIDLTKNTAKKRRHAAEIPTNKAILSTQPTSQDNQTLNNTINTEQKQQSSSSDNLAVLLTQGLQNNDLNVLDQVVCSRNEKFIEKTLRTLPSSSLLALVDCLNKYLYQSSEKGLIASKWLRVLLTMHSSSLMTYPDITERLAPMYELIDSHTKLYPKLARLHGKVLLIDSQINNHTKELSNSNDKLSTNPSLIFEDVSDDDIDGDQTQDELIPSPSEYDDYSGLSDDLDLAVENDYNEDEIEQITESDNDINFQQDGDSNEDDSS